MAKWNFRMGFFNTVSLELLRGEITENDQGHDKNEKIKHLGDISKLQVKMTSTFSHPYFEC